MLLFLGLCLGIVLWWFMQVLTTLTRYFDLEWAWIKSRSPPIMPRPWKKRRTKRRMTSRHHGRPVVKEKWATPHLSLDLWVWLLEFHLKKRCSGAEGDHPSIHHPSFHHSSSIGFRLNFIVLILFSSFVKWELSGGLILQGWSKGEKSSLRALLFQSRSSIRFSLEYWLVLIFCLYMVE